MESFIDRLEREIASQSKFDWEDDAPSAQDRIRSRAVESDGYVCEEHGRRDRRCCPAAACGSYGAAGVLFVHRESGRFFLAQRSMALSCGGTWSVPGGALALGETPEEGARREVWEELGIGSVGTVVAQQVFSRFEDWAYTTLVIEVDEMFGQGKTNWETIGSGWFSVQEMSVLNLHPGFRKNFWKIVKAWQQAPRSRKEG